MTILDDLSIETGTGGSILGSPQNQKKIGRLSVTQLEEIKKEGVNWDAIEKNLSEDPERWSHAAFSKELEEKEREGKKDTLDDFLEKTVKLDSVVSKHEEAQPFASTAVLLIHHLTREVLGTIGALRKLGCKDLGAQFLGYNPDAAKIFRPFLSPVSDSELMTCKLATDERDNRVIDRVFTKPEHALPSGAIDAAIKGKDYLTSQRSLALYVAMEMLARCETSGKKFLVIEDGGYIAPLLNDAALKKQSVSAFRELNSVAADIKTDEILAGYADMSDLVGNLLIGTVEHTRNGYDKVQKVYLEHGKLAKPHFTIAISYVKTQFEADSVVATCINSLTNALLSRGRVLRSRNVCVLGSRGNISGRAIGTFRHRLDGGLKQVCGVDLKVGFSSTEGRPSWSPSPFNPVLDNLLESRKYSDLPEERRKKIDVVFGVTGGRQKHQDDEKWDETLVPSDIEFWLKHGDTKYNEFWLVSGSTKTKEFELVKDFVEDLADKKQHNGWSVVSEDLVDPLTSRDYGQIYTFTSSTEVKTLISVADWKPANFMFYGVPTEDIDVILAQLVDVTVALLNNQDASPEVHAVDYTAVATNGIIDAVVDPLPANIPVPSPPDTKAAMDALSDLWTNGEKTTLDAGGASGMARVSDC